jgi:alpha-tubulin suppressor-like RCC1 family protein
VFCWGAGSNGRLGHGTGDGRNTPAKVFSPIIPTPSAPSITGATVGFGQVSVAFTAPSSDGGYAISNYQYSTDDGATWVTRTPAATSSPLVIRGLTNGTSYTIRLRAVNDGGGGTPSTGTTASPSELWSETAASTVEGGGAHSCAIAGGVLFCWGANGAGQLGTGTNTNATTAQHVAPSGVFVNTGDVSAVALGARHSCAIEGGVLCCWGANGSGQ